MKKIIKKLLFDTDLNPLRYEYRQAHFICNSEPCMHYVFFLELETFLHLICRIKCMHALFWNSLENQ